MAEPNTAEWWQEQFARIKEECDRLNPEVDKLREQVREHERNAADAAALKAQVDTLEHLFRATEQKLIYAETAMAKALGHAEDLRGLLQEAKAERVAVESKLRESNKRRLDGLQNTLQAATKFIGTINAAIAGETE